MALNIPSDLDPKWPIMAKCYVNRAPTLCSWHGHPLDRKHFRPVPHGGREISRDLLKEWVETNQPQEFAEKNDKHMI
jgi:hypothetical protein